MVTGSRTSAEENLGNGSPSGERATQREDKGSGIRSFPV